MLLYDCVEFDDGPKYTLLWQGKVQTWPLDWFTSYVVYAVSSQGLKKAPVFPLVLIHIYTYKKR